MPGFRLIKNDPLLSRIENETETPAGMWVYWWGNSVDPSDIFWHNSICTFSFHCRWQIYIIEKSDLANLYSWYERRSSVPVN